MRQAIETNSGQRRTSKLTVDTNKARGMLLPGPFAITDGDRRFSNHELSKPLSGKK